MKQRGQWPVRGVGLGRVEGAGPVFPQSRAQHSVRKAHRHLESQSNGDYVGRVYK